MPKIGAIVKRRFSVYYGIVTDYSWGFYSVYWFSTSRITDNHTSYDIIEVS